MSTEINNIIRKYLLRTISQQEKIDLEEWVSSSEDNRKLFNELLFSYKQTIAIDYLKSAKKHRVRKLFYAALAIPAMVAGLIVTLTLTMPPQPPIKSESTVPEHRDKSLNGIIISTNGESNSLKSIIKNDGSLHGVAITDNCLDYSKNRQNNVAEVKKEESVLTSIYVPNGEKFKIILSDGTILWINANTKVEYLSHYSATERRIKVEGEVFLDVTHNPSKPFIVETANSEIKVLGTKFDVRSYASDSNITTTLVEGSVSFNNEKVLRPNEQLQFNKATKNCVIKNVDTSLFSSWIDGNYYFDEITITELVKLFKRVYDVDILLKSNKTTDKTFTGSISSTTDAKDMFEIIMKTTKIEYVIDKEKIIIW